MQTEISNKEAGVFDNCLSSAPRDRPFTLHFLVTSALGPQGGSLENHQISSLSPRPQQMRKSVPEPPKLTPKSMKNRPGSNPNPPCPQFLQTLIFDDGFMNFNGFSSPGRSRGRPKPMRNASRYDTENIGRKSNVQGTNFLKMMSQTPPKRHHKYMKNQPWTFQGHPKTSRGHPRLPKHGPKPNFSKK